MVIMSHYVFPDSFRCATLVNDNAKCLRGSMTFTSSVETIPALSPMKKASDGGSSRRKKRSVSIKNSIRRFEAEQAQKNNAQKAAASAASVDANMSALSVASPQRGSTNRRDQQNQQYHNNQRSAVSNNSKLPSNPLVITPLSRGPIRERRNGKTRSTSNGNKSNKSDDSMIEPKISLSSTTPPKQPSRERSASDDSKNNDNTLPPPLPQRQESIIAYGSVVSEIKKLGKLDFNTSMSSLSPPPIPQRKTSLLVALQERMDDYDLNLDDLNSSLLSRVTEVDEFHNSFINPPIMPVRQLSILHNTSSDNFDDYNNNNNHFQSTTNISTKGMMRNNKGKDLLGSFIGEYDHDFMQLETTPK